VTRLALACLLCACGAKTGLLLPDGGPDAYVPPPDAWIPPDVGPDVPPIDGCTDIPFTLAPEPAEVVFVVDRSNSMALGLDGMPTDDFERSRWRVLGNVLDDTLRTEPLILAGAKFFPDDLSGFPMPGPAEVCAVSSVIDVRPGGGSTDRIIRVFDATLPFGGTPTVSAIEASAEFLRDRSRPGVPQFIVLATDGGPNCNPPDLPLGVCRCAGEPASCLDPTFGRVNCLDDVRAVEVIGDIARDIPVFVIGFDDTTRPDLTEILENMAVAGGRPRPIGAGRRFYEVQSRSDLESALGAIAGEVARCRLYTDFVADEGLAVTIRVNDTPIPEDPENGWVWRDRDMGEIELVGDACRMVTSDPSAVVDGTQTCFELE